MKKFNKKIISLLVGICCFCSYSFAMDFESSVFGTKCLTSHSVNITELDDGIVKKETVSILNYNYPLDSKKQDENYVTVQINITYSDKSTDKIIAVANMESNFRYNVETQEAVCLSTSKGNISDDANCTVTIFSRCMNSTTKLGKSIYDLKVNNKGKTCQEIRFEISCDYVGNVSYT